MTLLHKKAPIFSLPDENGVEHSLKDYNGKYLVVYFYPRDNTPGCTREACAIRDSYEGFEKLGVTVIGISGDSQKSHANFKEKYDLPFTLLSDKEKSILRKYRADTVGAKRKTYIIDPKGIVVREYTKVSPDTHARTLLDDLEELMQ